MSGTALNKCLTFSASLQKDPFKTGAVNTHFMSEETEAQKSSSLSRVTQVASIVLVVEFTSVSLCHLSSLHHDVLLKY